ncbi:MAG: hypothetical protein HY867_08120 [Chloroflexi bacterium]|nr:hypothetical protein [Chloroflexota bacterium]
MNLIDRYVREIGRQLPQKTRADIEKEIRSAVEDMLEDRSKKDGRAIDEEMTIAVLKEYGNPDTVAASYLPEQYLIGPQLFPIFWLVTKIVFAVLTTLAVIGLGFALFGGEPVTTAAEFWKGLFTDILGEYFSGMMAAFGNIVLVFALIQRFATGWEFKEKDEEKDWNPRDLPDVEDVDQVKIGEHIAEIVFIVLGLIVFNFYPEYIGIYGFADNERFFAPILSNAFFSYMPWINLLWGLQFALDVWLIQQRRWQYGSRLLLMAVKAGNAALAYAMLKGPSILGLTPDVLMSEMHFTADGAQSLAMLLAQVVKWGLIIAIVAGAVDVIKALVQMVRSQRTPVTA